MTDTDRPGDRRSIERELKRGSLELIVLHLLAPREAYGYEIVTKLTASTNGALEVTDGTLYPVLYRLERAGFVTVRWETPERGVPRKYYQLTVTISWQRARLAAAFTIASGRARRPLPSRSSGGIFRRIHASQFTCGV